MKPSDDIDQPQTRDKPALPRAPVEVLLRPLRYFLHIEAASGVVLLLCTAVALFLANSVWAEDFTRFWETPIRVGVGSFELNKTLLWWINDGVMAIFFFVVGLEIKRELVVGELRDPRNASLPAVAALGGMVVPAIVYFTLQPGGPAVRGWGVPMATDIAFVVGILAVLGSRVPHGLKILLLSLAIVDDLGAVLVIAVFYTETVEAAPLGIAAGGFVLVTLLNRAGVRRVPVYVILGAVIWLAVYKSGIHPTVAGVMLGLLTPASAWVGDKALLDVLHDAINWARGTDLEPDGEDPETVNRISFAVRESIPPLERLEHALHPWVAFLIMPLFALANAGVVVQAAGLADPVALAVALGLFLGKPVGIVLFSVVAVRLGFGRLPTGVTWGAMVGAGVLAGIGFTMSLFIAGLALQTEQLVAAKVGILSGSALSAVLGSLILLVVLRPRAETENAAAPVT